ncbi:MAG: serine/threonine-protein phosphatase [Deltaproteobacteria bacterium]|nr:serine/threonine-protein phosphatase [Deltaproteobacteria bacterium]
MNLEPKLEYHVAWHALTGRPGECGDAGLIIEHEHDCLVVLLDALGHGPEAHAVAEKALETINENQDLPLVELMEKLHENLKYTRGAVAALGRLDKASGELKFVGIGNINAKIYGPHGHTLLSRDGVVGYMMTRPRQETVPLGPGDILVLSSDGLRAHFSLHDHPELLVGSARQIVERMFGNFCKQNDDYSCLVLRYGL